MTFIDSSAYLAVLLPNDAHAKKAAEVLSTISVLDTITSYSVLGEVLTIGSMRYSRASTIGFVEKVIKGGTRIISESPALINQTFTIFKSVKNKNIGWVDCYSCAIIDHFKVENILTFDKDLQRLSEAKLAV